MHAWRVYDNRGNAVSRGAWGDQVFDLGNRLRSMSGQGVAASYDYDGHGRRTLISEPGVPRRLQMYNQGGLLLAEIAVDGSDTVTELQSYFYNGRNPIAERLRTPGSDVTTYVHADHLGSPMAKTSAFGSVYERTMFEPYGLKVGSAFNQPYGIGLFPDGLGFAGHRTDRVSGLSYMQQRYYDPVAGRFISMDPVTADSGNLFNRYAYANNSPISNFDPDGREVSAFRASQRLRIENEINSQTTETFRHDANGKLQSDGYVTKPLGSQTYTDALKSAISSPAAIKIGIQQTYTDANGVSVDIDARHGGGITAQNSAGDTVVLVIGNPLQTVDAAGNAITDSGADTLRHELLKSILIMSECEHL